MQKIIGYVERITFQNDENGFTVAKIQETGKRQLTTVVGSLPGIQAGETVCCYGAWKHNPAHGQQFQVERFESMAPADMVGIRKYLGSGLVKGIGPAYADRIVEKFGMNTLDVIDQTPERLTEVSGIGKKRIQKIKECWAEQRSIREVMIFLQQYGVSPGYAQKIFKAYGDQAIEKVSKNPYRLARDIFGIGFRSADTIAIKMGIEKDSPERIDAGIEFVLSELSNDGHVCYPVDDFLFRAQETLEVEVAAIEARLDALQRDERIVIEPMRFGDGDQAFVWLKPMYIAEAGISRELRRLQESLCFLRKVDTPKALDWVQKKLKLQLAENQAAAVGQALESKVQVITGGPGTGKSTITNAILAISGKLTDKIVLAAPTGRAAKRMSEITRRRASTIHSLLEFDFKTGAFKKGHSQPLDCDLLIVDEASMIDTFLMYSLLKAIPNRARVIFVGDINQLPSVGPGNVLKDLIQSESIPVTELNEIFRQARGSQIITNAHRINSGEFPFLKPSEKSDFFWVDREDKQEVLQTIVDLVSWRLPNKYHFDPFDEIQVLAPMRRGEIGTENLNLVLQERLNPCDEPLYVGGRRFHPRDKVMQIRNNYTKEVFNGDIGRIQEIDRQERMLIVTVDGREIEYDFTELDELVPAYAVSIHKYQGSECPCVVIPVHTSHFKLLHRNLLYTGVTRGKKLVVLVGMTKALAIAVRNDEVLLRYTGLLQRLKSWSPSQV